MSSVIEIGGQRFGGLIALRKTRNSRGCLAWECICDCGKSTVVMAGSLRSGHTRSCGCAKADPRPEPTEAPPVGARFVPLTKGKFAIVDDGDFAQVRQFPWRAKRVNDTEVFYAVRQVKKVQIFLHAFILGLAPTEMIDHVDRNPLNNRRENMRPCTHQENMRNRSKISGPTSSRWKGVSFCSNRKSRPWIAQIVAPGKPKFLGRFASEHDAALAYDRAAHEYFGAFALLNFPEPLKGAEAAG